MKKLFDEETGNFLYELFEEGDEQKTYSISVSSDKESSFVHDITTIYEKAYEIYESLIRNYVSPLHMEYIITDMIP